MVAGRPILQHTALHQSKSIFLMSLGMLLATAALAGSMPARYGNTHRPSAIQRVRR